MAGVIETFSKWLDFGKKGLRVIDMDDVMEEDNANEEKAPQRGKSHYVDLGNDIGLLPEDEIALGIRSKSDHGYESWSEIQENLHDKEYLIVRRVYKTVPLVTGSSRRVGRACTAAGWRLVLDPDVVGISSKRELKNSKEKIRNFLKNPNKNDECLLSIFDRVFEHLAIKNDASCELVYNKQGELEEMYFLEGYVTPISNEDTRRIIGYNYRFVQESGIGPLKETKYEKNEILRFVIPHCFDVGGLGASVVEPLSSTIAAETYSVKWNLGFFERAAIPKGVWVVSEGATEEQMRQFKSALRNMIVGPARAQATPIVVQGQAKYEKVMTTPQDADFVNLSRLNQEKMLAVMLVPPTKVGIVGQANRSVAEDQDKTFIEWDIRFLQCLVEQTLDSLFERIGWRGWLFRFKPASWLVTTQEAEVAKILVQAGIWSVNEAREETFGWDAVEGGDEHIAYMSSPGPIPLDLIRRYGEKVAEAAGDPKTAKALLSLLSKLPKEESISKKNSGQEDDEE